MSAQSYGRAALLAGAALAVVGLLVYLAFMRAPGDRDAPAAGPLRAEAIVAAGAARIVAESRGVVPPPVVEAAPNVAGRADLDMPSGPRPGSPDGYGFVEHFGEMTRARIEGSTGNGQPQDNGPGWLGSPGAMAALPGQAAAAGRDWAYGWIAPAGGAARADLVTALAGTGATIVGYSGRLIRARLPADTARLRDIARLAEVDGLGAAPAEAKLAAFDDGVAPGGGAVPVYVTLMAEDWDGRWRRAMEDLGAVVGGYDSALRAYRANADGGVIEALAAADFVLSVEPIRVVEAVHDTVVPALGVDALRVYDGAPGIFSGTAGASVPIAVMDTGLNINHLDIATHRDSICGANFAYNAPWYGPAGPLLQDDDLWIDAAGHGTHVTGTLAGNGFVQQRFAGMAPGVRHIRFAKVLDSTGSGFGDGVARGMDFLARGSRCSDAGRMSERAKPLVVNMSLAAARRTFRGRDAGARKLDSTVWSHRQLYVVSQSNAAESGFSDYGAAKNSLAVGAILDSGDLVSFSSRGPTADGRLSPNVVAPGFRVHSASGRGSRGGYRALNGTSMSSPAVAGVAALLMDAVPVHRERPALARARLMASAVRPDPWLADGGGFPTDNTEGPGPVQARFGIGSVSARVAVLQRDAPDGWRSGSVTAELEDGHYGYHDIVVPQGASRLDIVMTWDEPPADAVASTVLNDLDLWLDRDGDCETAACGEHASRSRVDSVEWIVVRNPEPGTYRVKVLAHRVYTAAPRAAVAWTVIRGASTPTLSVEADRARITDAGTHELTVTLTSDAYVAAGTRLRIDCRTQGSSACNELLTIERATLVRDDRVTVTLEDEQGSATPTGYTWITKPIDLGVPMPIGEVAVGNARQLALWVSIPREPEAGEAVLHFTASAWNALGGSAAVDVGPADGTERDLVPPVNDAFASAAVIEGEEGSAAVDLLQATAEPAEPAFDARAGRPTASVWYAWTAPTDGAFRFRVPPLPNDYRERDDIARYDRVHVFEGDAIASLSEVASALWHATFFAEAGATYRIRVSGVSRAAPVELRWSSNDRPVNDDFAEAIVLEGASGTYEGTTTGATLEPEEAFGEMAATTWFRWIAPEDGRWDFSGPRRVLIFEGDSIPELRLVGALPQVAAEVPGRAGREYRIAVADPDGLGLGGDYALRWHGPNFADRGNDLFEAAEPLGDDSESGHLVDIDDRGTVEPGEPADTGVRTNWWSWEAPEDALYTWRLSDGGERVPSYPKMRVTLWTGSGLDDLELAAEMGPGGPFETLLDAVGGETYWIAVGLPNGDVAAYQLYRASGKLSWGTTPDNDRMAGATALSGASGSVSGSNAFATGDRGERSGVLGRSTLWWTYDAEESGWVRFVVDGGSGPWALTVHREAADGLGGLGVVASSVWQRSEDGAVEVLFNAEAGVRYTVALGVREGGRGGEFTLRWDGADAPAWLRYAGRLADGDPDADGETVEIRGPRDLAMHPGGGALYLASELGLQVFERDPASGRLDHVQLLDTNIGRRRGALIWDAAHDRLLVDDCGSWHAFEPDGDGPELQDAGGVAAAEDPGTCGHTLLLDADGSDLYRFSTHRLEHFAVEEDGGLRFVSSTHVEVSGAVLAREGAHLYVVAPHRVLVFARDAETGAFTQTDFDESIEAQPSPPVPVAITDDDAYLFVFEDRGERTNLFSLADPANPERLASLGRFWSSPYYGRRCRFADARGEVPAVDVVCPGLAYTVRWDAEAAALEGTDSLTVQQPDRFNGPPMPDFDAPVDLVASPDDDHLYVVTPNHGILVFARDAAPVADGGAGTPDLAIQHVWASSTAAFTGATFRLAAVVRNRGGGMAGAMLRFYHSADLTITTADTEVGSVSVGDLPASGTRSRSVEVTAPTAAGTYRYGACVDTVSGESDTTNNCSGAVTVTVTEGDPDLVVDGVSADPSEVDPEGAFTLSVVVRNQGHGESNATTLRYYRSDDASVSSEDTEVGTDAVAALSLGSDSALSVAINAPADAGTVHYGACVDAVSGESDTNNNCSAGAAVTVRE